MTQLITERDKRNAKIAIGVLIAFAVVNAVFLIAEAFILQRIQRSQDELAVTQALTARAAADAQLSAQATEQVLVYLCERFQNLDCPGVPVTTTSTPGGR